MVMRSFVTLPAAEFHVPMFVVHTVLEHETYKSKSLAKGVKKMVKFATPGVTS